ncbi:hypothetical protein [Nostoc sp. 'Peltigera malacea cyanobiont' DB3992]|uniref:hypothetical protein n=1 Tax=Nostoc sp. 'Peltigera malacea cyanobiont' DB3992 TaxID=1206980 RepID=UPI000C0531C4|nr:hypothetical protein [Nostoc sp. 'Peltigera malacea cyanobiont' DB3992]
MTSWFFIKNEVAIDLLKGILYVFQLLNMRSLSKINLSGSQYRYEMAASASAIKVFSAGDSSKAEN